MFFRHLILMVMTLTLCSQKKERKNIEWRDLFIYHSSKTWHKSGQKPVSFNGLTTFPIVLKIRFSIKCA